MKITIPISLGVLHVLAQGAEAAEGFLSLPLTRQTHSQALVRRQADAPLPVAPEHSDHYRQIYMIDVDIGKPKQRVQLAVELATRLTMVQGSCESPSSTDTANCENSGAYNASLSTTSVYIAEDGFDEMYTSDDLEELSYLRFQYYADDMTVEGQDTLKNVTFRSYKSAEVLQFGVLGLGPGEDSSTSPPEPSILDNLKAQGLIGARAFGMTLGGDDSGSLVLGGVDTKKFSGALTRVPVLDDPENAEAWETNAYWMTVDGATLDSGNGTRTALDGFEVMAQSTSALSHLPDEIVIAVAEAFGVSNFTGDWDIIPCSRADSVNGSLELELSGFTASIPYGDLLLPYEGSDAREGDCYITIQPGDYNLRENPPWRLGSTFLRSVYAVFDQDDKAVWMAKYEDCGSEPVAFSKGSDVRGQCDGKASGESSSDEGGSSSNDDDDDSAGRRMGVNMALMVGAALAPLIF